MYGGVRGDPGNRAPISIMVRRVLLVAKRDTVAAASAAIVGYPVFAERTPARCAAGFTLVSGQPLYAITAVEPS